jgi:DNA-binding IclR family transcriptional regulator
MSQRYIVPALDRANAVLEILASSQDGVTLTELSNRTGVPKSSLFRILVTLEHYRYIEQDYESRKFNLGLKLWELGSAKLDRTDLSAVAMKHMKQLSHDTHESVFLGVLDHGEVIYLHRVDSPAMVKVVTKLGRRAPAYCTATGQAMLAFMPDDDVDTIFSAKELYTYNRNTITDFKKLKEKLRKIRRDGCAVADGEYNPNLLCISAPIWDRTKHVVAALTVAMLSQKRGKEAKSNQIAEMVKDTSRNISRELGFAGE